MVGGDCRKKQQRRQRRIVISMASSLHSPRRQSRLGSVSSTEIKGGSVGSNCGSCLLAGSHWRYGIKLEII